MDKVELTNADIIALLEWRDQHPAEVRAHPQVLGAVEIVCKESGYTVKGIRRENLLSLYLGRGGRSQGHVEFTRRFDWMWVLTKNQLRGADKGDKDMIQSILTLYCSLMALMAAGPVIDSTREPTESTSDKKPTKAPKKPTTRTTYIIRKVRGTILAAPRGFHASPRGIFTVRGHYRHYKSGKVVWVSEYKKGTGKKKKKTYKMGGKET